MAKNVQDTVYEIIKLSKQSGLRHITKTQIKEELMKTSLAKYEEEHYKNDKETKLDRMLYQALYHLSKNNKIKKKRKAKYTLDTSKGKYRPVICKHLEEREKGMFCPIKGVYIGDPRAQCELLHGTNIITMRKQVTPMCPGYTDKNPTPASVKYAKKAIAREEKRRDNAYKKAVARRG